MCSCRWKDVHLVKEPGAVGSYFLNALMCHIQLLSNGVTDIDSEYLAAAADFTVHFLI